MFANIFALIIKIKTGPTSFESPPEAREAVAWPHTSVRGQAQQNKMIGIQPTSRIDGTIDAAEVGQNDDLLMTMFLCDTTCISIGPKIAQN